MTSWWFNYGYSVGGDCIEYLDSSDAKFNVELKDNMYVATLNTFLGGTKVASSTMKFSGDNKFLSGEIVFNQWTTENFLN